MRSRAVISVVLICISALSLFSQNSVFTPYSRFGVGEIAPTTFAHNSGMGGAFIALRPDSTMPIFINAGNPAAYSLIRLTTLEVGGRYLSSTFTGVNNSTVKRWGTNFSYAALGVPIKGNGGACLGISPYSFVGYDTQSYIKTDGIGNVNYKFSGNGGLTKAYLGYGLMPFNKRLRKYRSNRLYIPDSLKTYSRAGYKRGEVASKLLSDFSLGFNVNYIFGTIQNATRVVYPNASLYYNTFYSRVLNMGGFTGNFGAQTAFTIDSVKDPKKRAEKIEAAINQLSTSGTFSEQELTLKKDSLETTLPTYRRILKERVKFTFGYFANITNPIYGTYSSATYNYVLNVLGQELIRDTAALSINTRGMVQLPFEQGFGLGFKKGERINLVADFAITNWQNFKYLDEVNNLVKNYRMALGVNFVPEKYAAGSGAFVRRVNYRLGVSYQTGYIQLQNTMITNYFVSAGVGLPVGIGRLSSMVNIAVQYGVTGSSDPSLLKENFWRINFGFTFCDRWFQKFRYD
ncbi:MAG: hypothetical protein PSX36_10360 [bacterium]|nr:hypothetical protein [bacterium]